MFVDMLDDDFGRSWKCLQWSWWMPDVGTEEGEDPSWESGATTQIEVMSAFSSHTHTHTVN